MIYEVYIIPTHHLAGYMYVFMKNLYIKKIRRIHYLLNLDHSWTGVQTAWEMLALIFVTFSHLDLLPTGSQP